MATAARRLIDAFLGADSVTAAALLAPDATFRSPIRDYDGAERIAAVWDAVAGVITGAQPTSVHERDGEAVVFFAGTIADRPVDGVLRAVAGEDDRVTDVLLMVRPWAALKAGIADVEV